MTTWLLGKASKIIQTQFVFYIMFENIKFIYFDLDNTIFDHKRAEQITLRMLHAKHDGLFARVSQNEFLKIYHEINTKLWKDFANNEITADELKVKRFALTLSQLKVDPELAGDMAVEYMKNYSQQKFLVDGSLEILTYLKLKYPLGILSNGFTETQNCKVENLNMRSFFEHFVYSGEVGALKPSPIIFEAARSAANVEPDKLVYVGDSFEADILGAKAAQWKVIFFDREQKADQQNTADATITNLVELRNYL